MKRELSNHAKAAKKIRIELKTNFPGVTFSVKSRCYTGGTSVDVEWLDGPGKDQVDIITSKYQQGHFNSMEDIYEYSNKKSDLPQVKYIQIHRDWSYETLTKMKEYIKFNYEGWENIKDGQYNPKWNNDIKGLIWREFINLSLKEIMTIIELSEVV